MIRAATWVAGLEGWRRAFFAILIGALSVLAFAPIHAWPVLFLTFGALVWLLDGCHARHDRLGQRLKCAGIVGFWFGFGYFLAGLYWIAEAFLVEPWRHGWLIPFVMTAMPGGMALFFAAAGALAMLLWQPGAGRVFALAIAVGIAEYARGHVLTGLPWNLDRLRTSRHAAADAARGPARRLCLEPPRRASLRQPLGDFRAARLRA